MFIKILVDKFQTHTFLFRRKKIQFLEKCVLMKIQFLEKHVLLIYFKYS